MISFKELLGNNTLADVPIKHQQNLEELLKKMNRVRVVFNKPMIITSGYRTEYDHRRIYSKKGNLNPPMGSKHLSGNACDVYDPSGELHEWCKQNEAFLEQVGLWLENRQGNWQHFQQLPFGSYKKGGSIWFNP